METKVCSKWGCECIIYMLNGEIEPENPYFMESKRRLTEEKIEKQHYINININRGVRI